jgi:hypothetical protein
MSWYNGTRASFLTRGRVKVKEKRTKRFLVSLSPTERRELQALAEHERAPGAAVIRRLIREEADRQFQRPGVSGAGRRGVHDEGL